jgi:chromosome segregation ATPase
VSAAVPATAQVAQPDSLITALFQEAQQLQQRLGQVEEQAFEQNAELSGRREDLQKMIEAEMIKADSSVASSLKRMDELPDAWRMAQMTQDQARMQAIQAEAEQLESHILSVEERVIEQQEVADRIEQFRENLFDEMEKIEPNTRAMIARLESIAEQLQPPAIPPVT